MSAEQQSNLSRVAKSLTELEITDVVFVGGATIALYITDLAAPEPRTTFDVDVVTSVGTIAEYHKLEARLRDAGHTPNPEGPICRWLISGITVDLMPTNESILGFSNRWYTDLIEHAQVYALPDGTLIRHASTPYLIATKLEAFYGRGNGDYRGSHDLEDLIIVLDGREEAIAEVGNAPEDVKSYVATTFGVLLDSDDFQEAVPEHLLPDAASQARAPIVLKRMQQIRRFA